MISFSPPKILVFDSGAGGLSVAKEIITLLPHCHLVFAADKGFFPYGLKPDNILTHRIVSQIELLHRQYKPDIVVIACNTASTLALEILRQEFSCPFVGVVPAIKPAALVSRSGVIGVLATAATINRGYTKKLIDDFASNLKVILYGSTCLAEIAENKVVDDRVDQNALARELEQLFNQTQGDQIDTVVLACTHFPLLVKEMDIIMRQQGRNIIWIDSGRAIARRVETLLGTEKSDKGSKSDFSLHTSITKIEFVFLGGTLNLNDLELKYRHTLLSNSPPPFKT